MEKENRKSKFLPGLVTGIVFTLIILYMAWRILPFPLIRTNVFSSDMENKANEIMTYVDTYYVDDYTEEDIADGIYTGMLYGLGDRYASYMTKEDYDSFMDSTEGIYAGIGAIVSISKTDVAGVMVEPYADSPADKAGLIYGDIITEVNGMDITDLALDEVTKLIKGPKGTDVNVTVYREENDSSFELTITRDILEINTVEYEMLEDNIGHIHLMEFDGVSYEQVKKAIEDLTNQGMEKLIFDIRNNPGGRLDTAVQITELFVPEGTIVYTEDKYGEREYLKGKGGSIDIPFVVLVNGNSASASEVFAGAIKDYDVATIVGEKTFGKGVVQSIFKLRDGSGIKMTTSKYYSPKGNSIDGLGIEPDIEISMDIEKTLRLRYLEYEEDTQLQETVEIIKDISK